MKTTSSIFETKTVTEVLSELKVQPSTGLTDEEVNKRQSEVGLNEVPEEKHFMVLVFLKHFWGLTPFMLEATIVASYLLQKYIDVYLISGLMFFNAIIGFIQECKAAKTVKGLEKSLQVFVRVLRNENWLQIPGNQLVPGDILRIRTGDFLAADAKIITGAVSSDQSELTGESRLINKKEADIIYAGSVIKNGECNAVVVATGIKTFFGKTAQLVQNAKPRLHMEDVVANVVKILFSIVLVFVIITTIISLQRGYPFISILPLVLILLISAVPVALPAMFTVSMANGSQQLANDGILVSRLSATEDAATLSTLCIDKTGTITQNKLSIKDVIAAPNFTINDVIKYAVLASVAANNDPIDMAFIEKAAENKIAISGYKQISFTPFSSAIKRTQAVIQKDNKQFSVIKGAYQVINELCHLKQNSFDEKVTQWAAKGFKTIAVAIEQNGVMIPAGIAALIDPPIPDSSEMISKIKELGIKIKMLTGDALPIAKEIATEVGIGSNIVGAGLIRTVTDSVKAHGIIATHNGFSDVLPEDKFNIVKTLQKYHEITGMTGDGVNDAPALKEAEVGIAVKSATDVAKQAASVILLNAGLKNIVNLITVGRTIHHRVANWVVSKLAKTLFTVVFVCISFIVTGQFIVNAFDMILLLFIIDFVSLTLSTDKVSWSQAPETWKIKPLLKRGFLIGGVNILEAFIWLFVGKKYLGISDGQLHSFGFAILFFTGIFNITIIRANGRFYKRKIGKVLLYTITVDILFAVLLLTIGITNFTPLPIKLTAITLLYFMFCSFVINDWIKTFIPKLNKIESKS